MYVHIYIEHVNYTCVSVCVHECLCTCAYTYTSHVWKRNMYAVHTDVAGNMFQFIDTLICDVIITFSWFQNTWLLNTSEYDFILG